MTKRLARVGRAGQGKKDPEEGDVAKIEAMIGDGCTHIEVARCLNISKDVFYRWRNDFPAVREAMELGLAREHKALRGMLIEKAMAGDTACIIFALKTRHQYREAAPVVPESRVHIQITLPGALTAEGYGAVIEADHE